MIPEELEKQICQARQEVRVRVWERWAWVVPVRERTRRECRAPTCCRRCVRQERMSGLTRGNWGAVLQ